MRGQQRQRRRRRLRLVGGSNGSEETLFPVGTRADRRNEIIYCVR